MKKNYRIILPISIFVIFAMIAPSITEAHCDSLSGPVIQDARIALEKKDISPVLKWIKKEDEHVIRDLFEKTLAVRAMSAEARDLADMHFFETLVRIHRAGEGVAFTGLKSAESIEPGIEMADESIEKGSTAKLLKDLDQKIENGIKTRFAKVIEARKHVNETVENGRAYVEAYVDYIHFVENIHRIISVKSHFDHSNEVEQVETTHQH